MPCPTRRPVVVAALVAASALGGCGSEDGPPPSSMGVVVQVVDGDTVEVGGVGRVRLVGVDTPEVGTCGSRSAAVRLADLVLGRRVRLVAGGQGDTDRYGRLLRYVEVNGMDVGLVLVQEGRAVARYDSRDGYGSHRRERAYVDADADIAGYVGCSPGAGAASDSGGVP